LVAREDIFIIFTMDCERVRRYSPPGGPETWELSECAIRGFSEGMGESDLLATFFIVPENAERHRALRLDLMSRGFELAIHYHSQSFGGE